MKTTIRHLVRDDLYNFEKPYTTTFSVNEQNGAKKTNIVDTGIEVQVTPITDQKSFDIDVHGFCVLTEDTSLTLEDAIERPKEAETRYHAELERILLDKFPEYTRLEALDFVVRRRHTHYPSNEKVVVQHEQPAAVAHADYTPRGAIYQLKGSFPGQESHFLDKEYDMINVWKPLVGPNDDWPLALCDFSSVKDSDRVAADVVHVDRITENELLYANEQHRWYYVPNQLTKQMIVFRNTDSVGKRPKSFHAAVANHNSKGPPRSSVEVRFVAFR